jgi:predicted RNA binding protein YcfA (HicA-like mRNA interferase family)
MSKVPRDISGRELANLLSKYKYKKIRETGSHIRLVSSYKKSEHKITIPDHKSIKIGTLNNILDEIAGYVDLQKSKLVEELFHK